jgi:hypothetical protein
MTNINIATVVNITLVTSSCEIDMSKLPHILDSRGKQPTGMLIHSFLVIDFDLKLLTSQMIIINVFAPQW